MNKTKNYTLKVLKNGEKVDEIRTHSIRLFLTHLRTIKRQKNHSVYLRVSYGKKECNLGCLCTFYNDGWYDNKKELLGAFKAFSGED